MLTIVLALVIGRLHLRGIPVWTVRFGLGLQSVNPNANLLRLWMGTEL